MARTFDPEGDHGGDGDFKNLEVAGIYLVAFVRFVERGFTPTRGTEFLKYGVEVVEGSHAGESFLQSVWLSQKALGRLAAMTKAMGLTKDDAFDLDSNEACNKALLFRPFKANVSINNRDGRKYAEISKALDMNATEGKIADAWRASKLQEVEASGKNPYSPEDGWTKGDGAKGAGLDQDESWPDDDEDIPF